MVQWIVSIFILVLLSMLFVYVIIDIFSSILDKKYKLKRPKEEKPKLRTIKGQKNRSESLRPRKQVNQKPKLKVLKGRKKK